jgi:Spy/CpxP family protein refolding chaperone
MKTVRAALLAAAFALPAAFAQAPAAPDRGSPAAIDAIRQAAKDDRRGLVEKNMQLTDAEAKKFRPVYDTYANELEAIAKRQNRAVLDYVNQESSMTDANAQRLAGELLATDADEMKLRKRTYEKLRALLNARKAARFVQIENKLRTLQRYDVASQVPLVR